MDCLSDLDPLDFALAGSELAGSELAGSELNDSDLVGFVPAG